MARPSSFNDLELREGKNRQGQGKVFEGRMFKGLKMMPGFTRRFPDVLNVDNEGRRKNTSTPSPPDYIHVGARIQLLVECKAVKGKKDTNRLPTSVPIDRVPMHQLQDLLEFDAVSDTAFGVIAFNLYNDGLNTAWLIPVREWVTEIEALDRDSVPISIFQGKWSRYEMDWLPGKQGSCFNPSRAVRSLM